RLPLRCRALPGRTRVVSLVRCDESPVGGVTVWSKRLARALAERNSRFDMRTLLVVTHPDSLPERSIDDDGLTQTCVLDPMADRWAALETLRASIARLQPEIICPNYADICYAAATLHRCAGARIVPIAHTDHESYRDLMAFYDHWEAAAGVSDACMQWLEPLAGDRPTRKIVYGVPVAGAPRTPAPDGPLRLAYIGRMVEPQKRISDLLAVIDGLERRAISYELHMVGDGVDLPAWRRRLAERTLRSGRVRLHGRCSPDEVQRLLADIDISLLVSDYEGASITMLEAMGAGVVPVVTRVGSGVGEWVTDGETGMVVDIGDTEAIADRLGQLAGDRALLGRLGRAAWERARSAISVDRMATQYEELFGAAMAQGRDTRPTDTGLRFIEHWTWRKNWCDEPEAARRWIRGRLGAAGFARVVEGRRVESVTPGSAVILSDDDPRAESLRARGVGVACAPSLHECEPAARLRRAVRAAAADGAERIAIYGLGLHTRRCAGLFLEGLPIAGIIDDDPPTWGSAYGVPVVTAARAPHDLRPDVVILSSDRFERQMWDRSAPLRAAGVPVIALYGSYDDAAVERTAVA
ncbi:MAG: glycosyltransferase, partial [Phycisphaerales bacterium JB039]